MNNHTLGAFLVIAAAVIAITGHSGWGWFLLLALFTLK